MRNVLRGIDEELRKERPYPRIILVPLEIAGVDGSLDSSIVIHPAQDVLGRPMALVTPLHRLAELADTSPGA